MKKYIDCIGKTFKGFKFEDEEDSGLSYNYVMDKFIGKDLKIEKYRENDNSFITDSGYLYPSELVIEQLEKQEAETFKPKRGDKVLAWDSNEGHKVECIFLTKIEGAKYPYLSVTIPDEKLFEEGKPFSVSEWKYIEPLPQKVIPKDTLVWCKNTESSMWEQRFYSNYNNGKHYCFINQEKSNQTTDILPWNIVTEKNPY
jgi:hypothetical protein